MTTYWLCRTCGASGEGDKAAEQHVRDTTHPTETRSRPWTAGPCQCWTATWSEHDGHCCFRRDSPEDCHDEEAGVRLNDRRRDPRNHEGDQMAKRYWLTDAGWAALGGRST